jgi:phosphoglycolate phosphatase
MRPITIGATASWPEVRESPEVRGNHDVRESHDVRARDARGPSARAMTAGQSTMAVRAVLFDKDGTLVDFRSSWLPATEQAARALCLTLAVDTGRVPRLLRIAGYETRTGVCDPRSVLACGTTRELARLWDAELGVGDVERIEAHLEEAYARDVRAAPVAVEGLGEALCRLRALGLQLGVATMDTEQGARATLARLGIERLFSFVCGYDSGLGEKPDSGMVDAFCAEIGIGPGEVAVVGDTTHDCLMGSSAGAALVVGVLSGASSREMLAPHCHHVLESVAELETVLGR